MGNPIYNTLAALLKGANPDASDDDIHQQATSMSQHPDAASVIGSLSAKPSLSSDMTNLNIPSANDEKSSFDVPVSDNTITMNGKPESLPSASAVPTTPLPPVPEVPASPPAIPSVPAAVETAPKKKGKSSELAQALQTPSNDNAQRLAAQEEEKKKHDLGIIPVALGGAADALGNAAKPFGGEGAKNSQADVEKELETGKEQRQAQLETNIKNDPNSDISKSYRQMVLEIAPEMAKQPNFQNMSAEAIGEKLPLIDTVMKAKATEATRQLMLQQQKGIRDQGFLGKAQQQFNNDKVVQNATSMNAALQKADSLLASGQPIPRDMIGLIMAPAITGVKRFNAQELGAFRGEKDIPGKIAQVLNEAATGKFTGNNKQLYQNISQTMQTHNNQDIQNRGALHAKQLASQAGGDWKQHYQDITSQPYQEPSAQPKTSNKDPLGIL